MLERDGRSSQEKRIGRRKVLRAIAAGAGAATLYPVAGAYGTTATAIPDKLRTAQVRLDLGEKQGPLHIDHFGVGHGGYWAEPTWLDRACSEVRALKSKHIRLFVQEYYDLLPSPGRYHWTTLDQSVDMILKAGSKPLMCLTFKPQVLFPRLDQNIVYPNDWNAWETLVYELVLHYKDRGAGIEYWEVGNEGDIGAGGGCPYKFTPESYSTYYQHTVQAIRRADPNARVGGPALARHTSPILPALLSHCDQKRTPLDFVSWHNYNSDPETFTESITYIKNALSKYPSLHPETVLDEWNASIGNPPLDPRFQPCFIAEVVYRMVEEHLGYSNYYQIRDCYVDPETMSFLPWWNPASWNRTSLMLGLFDFQNVIRPAYFCFRLLSRLTGERVPLHSDDTFVHGLASYDDTLKVFSVLLWNFSDSAARVNLALTGAESNLRAERVVLDSMTPSNEEFARLRRQPQLHLERQQTQATIDMEPYGVTFWSLRSAG